MRDVKRKICLDLDMAGLMDDENGMELLVRGHIVGLDLPIHLVYEQIWSENGLEAGGGGAQSNMGRGEGNGPMEIVFRLQGLDGEATEPLVDTLHEPVVVVDPEKEAAITALMRFCVSYSSLAFCVFVIFFSHLCPSLRTMLSTDAKHSHARSCFKQSSHQYMPLSIARPRAWK